MQFHVFIKAVMPILVFTSFSIIPGLGQPSRGKYLPVDTAVNYLKFKLDSSKLKTPCKSNLTIKKIGEGQLIILSKRILTFDGVDSVSINFQKRKSIVLIIHQRIGKDILNQKLKELISRSKFSLNSYACPPLYIPVNSFSIRAY